MESPAWEPGKGFSVKRGTENLVKFKVLQEALGLTLWQTKGLLQAIWDFVSINTPAGDIGRYPDAHIAVGIDWKDDVEVMLNALADTGWLDRSSECRYIVHGWAEHCEDSVHMSLARKHLRFADGTLPRLTRLPKDERERIEAFYKADKRTKAHGKHTTNALPSPIPEPEPEPRPIPKPEPLPAAGRNRKAGVFDNVTADVLADPLKLKRWFEFATSQPRPVVSDSEQNLRRVFACAERALEAGDDPQKLFGHLVGKAKWEFITDTYEDRASEKIRSLARSPPESFGMPNGIPTPATRRPTDDDNDQR